MHSTVTVLQITCGVRMRPFLLFWTPPVFCCAVVKVIFSCNLPLAGTLSYKPSSVTTFITEPAPKSSGPSQKVNRILKWRKNGDHFLPGALSETMFLCDFQTTLIESLFCFFYNPHHILPHWLQTDTLLIDYQFTFSLSQEDDRYYTAINFVATPEEVCVKQGTPHRDSRCHFCKD